MSGMAGLCFYDGRPVEQERLLRISQGLAEYGPDECNQWILGSVGMVYRPFFTTTESRQEKQPYTSRRGKLLMWDGRLDNREDLVRELGGHLPCEQADVAIVACAYESWGPETFVRLIGDWALSIWDPAENTVVLARDYAAVRRLYYHATRQSVVWCTHLAPLVIASDGKLEVNEEYVAGYLVRHADASLTPYKNVQAVPPGSWVKFDNGKIIMHAYWSLQPKSLRYRSDAEYEEHFRHLFRQAVRRRLRSDSPILAELSGGLDSSSIVCMADDILSHEGVQSPRLDTLSFYDSKEPEGDDHLYFTKVEEKRGRHGVHADLAAEEANLNFAFTEFIASPGAQDRPDTHRAERKILQENGYRVVLSGLGGDEFCGEAWDPKVYMGDLLARFRWRELATQLKLWSLASRRPWIHLFLQACAQFLPLSVRGRLSKELRIEPAVNPAFARRCHLFQILLDGTRRRRPWLPGHADALATLTELANQMGDRPFWAEEVRYPFLDRDLVEFLVAIPPDQLKRPGESRFLMRRALAHLLPPEVLRRRTKGGAGRCYIVMVQRQWNELEAIFRAPLSASLGFLDATRFLESLRELKNGILTHSTFQLLNGIKLELWLRDVARRGIIHVAAQKFSKERLSFSQSKA